jgi:tRNA(fMet)-specific endonuclease VapC
LIRYLLDTNILSHLVREPRGSVAAHMAAAGGSGVCATSIVVSGEMRFGVLKRGSLRLTASVEAVLGSIAVLGLDDGVDRRYGIIRHALERSGNVIGANDLWIAAHAISLGLTLVTDNFGEFGRIEGLDLENWVGGRPP